MTTEQKMTEWIERSNAEALYHLERQGRSSLGIIPFIGAGLSTSFGFKDWRTLLIHACPPGLLNKVTRQLDAGDYEDAAETLLVALGADAFQGMVAAAAGDRRLDKFDLKVGTVSLLPLLAKGPVVTTNFDRILERAFAENGASFDSVISGPRPDLIVDALHGNRRVLIKLHGDWQDRVGRTFARSDYEAHYGASQPEKKRELLSGAERLLFSSRSMLFIGASLGADRTVEILKAVHNEYAGVRHYAVIAAPKTLAELQEREVHLRSCGVTPLWYQVTARDHHAACVEALLAEIVLRLSVHTLDEAPKVPPASTARKISPRLPKNPPVPAELCAHLDRVERLVREGHLTFFLGSAIHYPNRLMAAEFYGELARVFECEALTDERSAVAQYIADRHGRETLNGEIRKLFARSHLKPADTHLLFADWARYKNPSGTSLPYPTIFTTNYDDVLEQTLRDAGLPFHLFTYQASGPHRGLFCYQADAGALLLIERPDNIRSLAPGFVIVKFNGGLDRRQRIPESFAATRLDFWDLASRIPQALPEVLRCRLVMYPLLFLGHGMAAPDIEAVVRYAHGPHPGARSWAVAFKNDSIEYWKQCGVEILRQPVNLYANELRRRLLGGAKRRAPKRLKV